MESEKEIIILVGNIGSGKSTIAKKYAQRGYVIVNMDSIQQSIHGGEYGMYDPSMKEIYKSTEIRLIDACLSFGKSVVIDRTNMDSKRRKRFILNGMDHKAKIKVIDFGPGHKKCLERRIKNDCRQLPQSVWEGVYQSMFESYEKPSAEEGIHEIIEAPKSFKFYAFDFDGLIVENNFPEIGVSIQPNIDWMNEISRKLSNIIIIWTCRSGDYLSQAKQWLIKHKVPFDFINENPMCDFGSHKIFAHEYYDDRNMTI